MKWIVPGPNTKVLAQAVHCLAKIGEDLYIEGLANKLSFRTVNFSKTAFASFNFHPDFFSFYPNVRDEDVPRCQISMKAALIVFRFTSGMEKSVESCAINLACDGDLVEFRLKKKQGFVKTNKVQLIECEVLQAGYETEELPYKLLIDPKVLAEVISSFQTPEITWAISNRGVQFRNFSELQDDGSGLRSEVHVSKEELIDLDSVSDTELTFCLAELRTVLAFAEHVGCPISVSFSESGKPMFFIVRNEILTAHVVLSTLGLSTSQSTANSSQSNIAANRTNTFVCDEEDDILSAVPQQVLDSSQDLTPLNANSTRKRKVLDSSQESCDVSQRTINRRLETLKKVLTKEPFDVKQMPGYDQILAPDSDEEIT